MEIDDQVAMFRQRRLDHTRFSYVYVDANGREHGPVVSRAVIAVTGVTEHGRREVLGVDVATPKRGVLDPLLRGLKDRDLKGVLLVISDAHSGIGPRYWAIRTRRERDTSSLASLNSSSATTAMSPPPQSVFRGAVSEAETVA